MSIHRAGSRAFFLVYAVFLTVCLGIIPLGIQALLRAPCIQANMWSKSGVVFITHADAKAPLWHPPWDVGDRLIRIGPLPITPEDLLAYPEFSLRSEEDRWWSRHKQLYDILQGESVSLVTSHLDKQQSITTRPLRMGIPYVVKRAGFMYFTVFFFIIMSLYIAYGTPLLTSRICSLLLISIGLYFAGITPLQARELALHPAAARLFVYAAFLGISGFITIVHFAMVFPERKQFVVRHPWVETVPYLYSAGVALLYYSHVTAYGSAFPGMIVWILVIIALFAHSVIRAKDRLIRHITLLAAAPLLLCMGFYTLMVVIPAIHRRPILYYPLLGGFSFILPTTLPFAIRSLGLHQYREKEHRVFNGEKNKMAQELHDHIGNDLMTIRLIGEQLGESPQYQSERFDRLRAILLETVRRDMSIISDFIWAVHPADDIHGLLVERVRAFSETMSVASDKEITVETAGGDVIPLDSFSRYQIFCMVKEGVLNAVKHSSARHIHISIAHERKFMTVIITDDGKGFPAQYREGRGIRIMQKRTVQIGASLAFHSEPDRGVRICMHIPLDGVRNDSAAGEPSDHEI
ncbi:MAG TPA: hypothetical protein P5567_15450 [Kiritimatiellia bacterium]|nr:hypothetical protein [Kiritimatiellia bacterium]HSA19751.1 hypothetical protein [Kiritimatiellia bacterium]